MKKNYEEPRIEVVDFEIEDSILSMSDLRSGDGFGDELNSSNN